MHHGERDAHAWPRLSLLSLGLAWSVCLYSSRIHARRTLILYESGRSSTAILCIFTSSITRGELISPGNLFPSPLALSFLEHARESFGDGRDESERRKKGRNSCRTRFCNRASLCKWFGLTQTILIWFQWRRRRFTGSFAWRTYRWRSMRRIDFYAPDEGISLEGRPNVLTHWNVYVDLASETPLYSPPTV